MSQNLAKKFSPKVQESFKTLAFTNNAVNHEYDFVGVNSISIYSVDTVAMENYNRTNGTTRYGTANNLGTSLQTVTLANDRSFTFTIDKRDNMDSMNVLNPGAALKRQIEHVVVPEIDKYRLGAIVNGADQSGYVVDKNISKTNAYECLLDAFTKLMNDGVPMAGAVVYITPYFYKQIRLDSNFIKSGDLSQEMLIKGQVGTVDGIPLVLVPDSYFPSQDANTERTWTSLNTINAKVGSGKCVEFLVANKAAVVGAEKLIDYKVHDNPPGINGWLIEGRICYDAFVLDKKKHMLYVHTAQKSQRAVTP